MVLNDLHRQDDPDPNPDEALDQKEQKASSSDPSDPEPPPATHDRPFLV